jgi:hypothetical protein
VTIETKRSGAFDSDLAVKEHGRSTWSVLAPLIWTGTKGDTFTVPAGFVTDFATVPRFLVWKMLPYGPYTRAAVLHDWLLVELAAWMERHLGNVVVAPIDGSDDDPQANSRDCDGIFRRVMEDLGVPWMTRWQMWAAVRVGALFNSRRAYGRNFTADAPRVLGILLITAPVLLPGAIGVLISLGLAWPFAGRKAARAKAGA